MNPASTTLFGTPRRSIIPRGESSEQTGDSAIRGVNYCIDSVMCIDRKGVTVLICMDTLQLLSCACIINIRVNAWKDSS